MSDGGPPEQRRHPRFGVDVDAKATLESGEHLEARTRDVSRTGICLVSPTELGSGAVVHLELVLSLGESAFSEPLVLSARVVWCTSLHGQFQIGAMFDDLSEEQEGYLDVFLQFLDGSLAPRGEGGEEPPEDDTPRPPRPEDKDDPFKN